MTSFGVAPALVIYEWILQDLGRWGWLAAFVYVAGAALRLARFNTNIAVVDKRFFQGLPSPAAAALVAGFVWLAIDNKLPIHDSIMAWVAFVLTMYAGVAMVSNASFFSGKNFALGAACRSGASCWWWPCSCSSPAIRRWCCSACSCFMACRAGW